MVADLPLRSRAAGPRPQPLHAKHQEPGGEISRVLAPIQTHLMLAGVPRDQIEQELAHGRVLFGLGPHELDDLCVAGEGLAVDDDGVEEGVQAQVLQVAAADVFGEDVEADHVRVGAAVGGEGRVV